MPRCPTGAMRRHCSRNTDRHFAADSKRSRVAKRLANGARRLKFHAPSPISFSSPGGAGTPRRSRSRKVAGRREHVLDLTMQAIQSSLDGLAARQRIIAQNLANSETPGYIAQTVSFEDSLASAVASGDPTSSQQSTGTTSDPTTINGKTVNVDTETLSMVTTGRRCH